jgi:hypothetical protein
MCIICVKPNGTELPSNAILNQCWQGNNDGAGLVYHKAGMDKVHIIKGFMKLKQLKEVIKTLNLGVDDDVIIHFRFATHGLVDSGNCHPFPLSKHIADLRCTDGLFNTAIAHNGVFGNMPCHDTLSDTMKFISGIMANDLIRDSLDNPAIMELISGYCGQSSKLAILRPDKIILIGDFIQDNGIYYSNHGYKPYTPPIVHNPITWQEGQGRFDSYPLYNKDDKNKCLLCETMKNVEYRYNEQAYLCNTCLEFNLANNRGEYYD